MSSRVPKQTFGEALVKIRASYDPTTSKEFDISKYKELKNLSRLPYRSALKYYSKKLNKYWDNIYDFPVNEEAESRILDKFRDNPKLARLLLEVYYQGYYDGKRS